MTATTKTPSNSFARFYYKPTNFPSTESNINQNQNIVKDQYQNLRFSIKTYFKYQYLSKQQQQITIEVSKKAEQRPQTTQFKTAKEKCMYIAEGTTTNHRKVQRGFHS